MKYDFDTLPQRWKTNSVKWNYRELSQQFSPELEINFPPDEEIMPFWVADTDLECPPFVIKALQERLEIPTLGYQLTPESLKEAVVTWMKTRHGWQVQAQDVVLLPEVVAGFNLAAHAVTEPGDGCLLQTPAYGPFFRVGSNTGLEQHEMELVRDKDGKYVIDWDAFEAAIRKNTRIFMLCNPQNPTGRVFTREELLRMAEICLEHNILICSDEIHSDLVYSGHKHIPVASLSEEIGASTITLVAPSKTFNLAGMKTAFAIIPNPQLRKKFQGAGKGLLSGVNGLGMIAAETAYVHGADWVDQLNKHLEGNAQFLEEFINTQIPRLSAYKPEGTFLSWIDCSELKLDTKPYLYLIEQAGIVVNDGEWFGKGGENHIRMNFGCPRSYLQKGLEKMMEALKKI